MVNIANDYFPVFINKAAKKVTKKKFLAFFLSSNKNQLIKAHFADADKGVCIKLDVLAYPIFFSMAKALKYNQA
jgi:hypothetical protein